MDAQILNLDIPPIETTRLTIRSPLAGDGPAFNAAIIESLSGLQQWLGIYQDGPPLVEETEALVRQKHAEFILRQDLMMIAFLKGTDTVVLSSGMHPNWKVPSFEIGYWCRQSYQGQGYVTEAVRGITNLAFSHLHSQRVFIRCDTDNVASANVARRAGFALEGTHHNDGRKHTGGLRSTHIFAQVAQRETIQDHSKLV